MLYICNDVISMEKDLLVETFLAFCKRRVAWQWAQSYFKVSLVICCQLDFNVNYLSRRVAPAEQARIIESTFEELIK